MEFVFTVNKNPLQMTFTTQSVDEGLAILADKKNQIGALFAEYATDELLNGTAPGALTASSETDTGAAAGGEGTKKRRGRGAGKDPATATAPDPIPALGTAPAAPSAPAAPAAPIDTTLDANGVPAFLSRQEEKPGLQAPAFVQPAAPPVMPAAPPVVPAAAPVVRPADKVIAELNKRGATEESKAALLKWLSDSGVTVPTATWDDAMKVLGFLDESKVSPLAQALNVA